MGIVATTIIDTKILVTIDVIIVITIRVTTQVDHMVIVMVVVVKVEADPELTVADLHIVTNHPERGQVFTMIMKGVITKKIWKKRVTRGRTRTRICSVHAHEKTTNQHIVTEMDLIRGAIIVIMITDQSTIANVGTRRVAMMTSRTI